MQRTDSVERPWCWERLKAGGEGDDRGWNGWMASLTLWTWIWASSGSWWWTGKPGVLQSMGLQSVRHDWGTELELNWILHGTSLPLYITSSKISVTVILQNCVSLFLQPVWSISFYGLFLTCIYCSIMKDSDQIEIKYQDHSHPWRKKSRSFNAINIQRRSTGHIRRTISGHWSS